MTNTNTTDYMTNSDGNQAGEGVASCLEICLQVDPAAGSGAPTLDHRATRTPAHPHTRGAATSIQPKTAALWTNLARSKMSANTNAANAMADSRIAWDANFETLWGSLMMPLEREFQSISATTTVRTPISSNRQSNPLETQLHALRTLAVLRFVLFRTSPTPMTVDARRALRCPSRRASR